jgi:hypothetical protein
MAPALQGKHLLQCEYVTCSDMKAQVGRQAEMSAVFSPWPSLLCGARLELSTFFAVTSADRLE